MVKEGRTMAEAIKAGNWFQISRNGYSYDPPACESPEEVMACARKKFGDISKGEVFQVHRIIGGGIGSRVMEYVGEMVY